MSLSAGRLGGGSPGPDSRYHRQAMQLAIVIYLAGVLVGLSASDAPLISRVALAALWPVGVAAFVVTVAILLAASLVAFPAVGATVAALAAGLAAWAYWIN